MTNPTDPAHIAAILYRGMGIARRFYYHENPTAFGWYCKGADEAQSDMGLQPLTPYLLSEQIRWRWMTGLSDLANTAPSLADVAAYEAHCEREELAYPTLAPAPIDERTDLPARLRAEQLDLCLGPSPRPIGW